MSMTRGELKTLIRELLGDRKGKSFSTDQLSEAVEYAVNIYCEKTGCTYREDDTTIDQTFLDIPEKSLRVMRVITSTKGELEETTIMDETSRRPTWRADAAGEPGRWMNFNSRQIRVHPEPNATARTYLLGFIEAPDPIIDDSDPITEFVPNHHLRLLRYAAAAWLLTDQGDEEDVARAQGYMQIFNSSIGA